MDEQTIDKIFHDVEDVEWIAIGSGEPLLELGRIEYLVDKLIESGWSTRGGGNVLYTEDASEPQGISALYNSLVERGAATNN